MICVVGLTFPHLNAIISIVINLILIGGKIILFIYYLKSLDIVFYHSGDRFVLDVSIVFEVIYIIILIIGGIFCLISLRK